LELAAAFGADVTLDLREFSTPAARIGRVHELTDGEGADAVLEVVGSPAVIAEGIDMLASGGVYLEVGNVNQKLTCEFNPASIVHGGKTILGLMWYQPESLQKALQLLSERADRYPFHKLLSHQYPLSAIDEAFRDQDAGRVHRAALLPWG
jgi:threonine dehydrogenase-like Zn-dependent dehydrogenase